MSLISLLIKASQLQPITYKEIGGLPLLRLKNSAGADNLNPKLLKPAVSLRGEQVTDTSNLALFSADLPSVGIYARVMASKNVGGGNTVDQKQCKEERNDIDLGLVSTI